MAEIKEFPIKANTDVPAGAQSVRAILLGVARCLEEGGYSRDDIETALVTVSTEVAVHKNGSQEAARWLRDIADGIDPSKTAGTA